MNVQRIHEFGSRKELDLRVLRVANGTTRDINVLQVGAGVRDVGDVVTGTITRQNPARDGHQEGVLNHQDMPDEWRGDGTQAILFVIDQLTLTTLNAAIIIGCGVLADVGALQTDQVGTLRGLYSTSNQTRMVSVNATAFSALALNLGTFGRMYLRYSPNWNGSALVGSMVEPWVRNSAKAPVVLSSGLCEVTSNAWVAPRMCVTFNATSTTPAENTVSARIRYCVQEFLPMVDR